MIVIKLLQASLQIAFFHIQIVVYFHEHKSLTSIMEFVHVLDHVNHVQINFLYQLLINQLLFLSYYKNNKEKESNNKIKLIIKICLLLVITFTLDDVQTMIRYTKFTCSGNRSWQSLCLNKSRKTPPPIKKYEEYFSDGKKYFIRSFSQYVDNIRQSLKSTTIDDI